jgi:hypothetical protein
MLFHDDPSPQHLWSTEPLSAASPPSGEICEHNSKDFFGVKERYPHPSTQQSYGAKVIIDLE